MAAGAWVPYDHLMLRLADGTLDLDDTTAGRYKCALFLGTSDADVGTETLFSGLTNEHAAANGYTAGGNALTAVTFTSPSAGVAMWDAADVQWTATGGSITARYAVIYQTTTVNGFVAPLICRCQLDAGGGDVTATDGNTFTIIMSANGILRLSRTP